MLDYERNPQAIYDASFAKIASERDLTRYEGVERSIATRLIHACGMVDVLDDLVISYGAGAAGADALASGAPIITDVQMVAHGIIKRKLPADNAIHCAIEDPRTAPLASEMRNTRSAAAMALLKDHLGGAVVAIGNAPTALFHLLEMLQAGAERPAVIIGIPVGFVGAVESKDALIDLAGDIPFVTVKGRRGGSAMAASVVNAMAAGLST